MGRCPPLKPLFCTTAASRFDSLLHRCATASKSLPATNQLHAHAITCSLLSNHNLSLLTSAYAQCRHRAYALKVFDVLPNRTTLAYKSVIRMHAENGRPRDALHLFVEMRQVDCCLPDEYTYPFVIRACGDLVLLELGQVIHGLTVKEGFLSAAFLGNCLLAMYMNCGYVKGAATVFAAMEEKTIVSWNTMISGCFRNGKAAEALAVFNTMVDNNVEIDSATALSVLPACGRLKDLEVGRLVQSLAEGKQIGKRMEIQNALVDMYGKCGKMEEARAVFNGMVERDVVSWTCVINGYICDADVNCALEMFQLMQVEGVRPNAVTVASLLSMCADVSDLKLGKCLHGWVIRQCIDCDVNVETALINLYTRCNLVGLSLRVFSTTSKKDTVPWNAVLSGCIHNKMAREAIDLFKQMHQKAVRFDEATWKSLLPALSIEGDLPQVTNLHGYLIRSGFSRKPDIVTSLIDIYSKCGCLQYAHQLFDSLPVSDRDIVSWSAIISGYGMHGQGQLVLSLFNQMVQSGVKPNEVTFTSVLHACGHAGLVGDGLDLFNFMVQNYQETLQVEHYTCIVDLLGRADRLKEAYELINIMPFEPIPAVWGALLGACMTHENVELAEVAAEKLFELEPGNTGNYVLMGNIYSAVGRFRDAEKIRQRINTVGLTKVPANSVI